MRIGHGFDVHKFGGNGPLMLAGVAVPYEQGFIAHSDGDVAIHALCDAILGALCLGDIGNHFPDNDDQYENTLEDLVPSGINLYRLSSTITKGKAGMKVSVLKVF